MRHEIQNPMVVDCNWNDNQKSIGVCKACGWEIYDSEEFLELECGTIHHDINCIKEYDIIKNESV